MHTVVLSKPGMSPSVKRSLTRLLSSSTLVLCLMTTAGLSAQDEPGKVPDATDDPVSSDQSDKQRHIQRLGEGSDASEWKIDLVAPAAQTSTPKTAILPDDEQDRKLRGLLSSLAADPEDLATRIALDQFLAGIFSQAEESSRNGNLQSASSQLDVIQSIKPDWPGASRLREEIRQRSEVLSLLSAARKAVEQGQIDQPESSSAWSYYQNVIDIDPANSEAKRGLVLVQQEMITRAIEYARDLDFESADRILEDASYVREQRALIDDAQEQIAQFRNQRVEKLEFAAVSAMDSGDFAGAERVLIDMIALGGADTNVAQLRRRLEESRVYGGFKPGQVIRDHFQHEAHWTPNSVVVLAGRFMMGSTTFQEGHRENEAPQHRVTFRRGFAIGQYEVTVAEFRAFVELSRYRTDAEKVKKSTVYDHHSGRLTSRAGMNWKKNYEGRSAADSDPVVHVSWSDAQAYVDWLARGTGKVYRLPSEAEFEFVLRGGKSSRYWWGDGSPARVVENITGEGDVSRSRRHWSTSFTGYSDKFWGPAPVGSFIASPFGTFDIGGNVGEWVRDCWHDSYMRAPTDGSAWINPGCAQRVIRGGSWSSSPEQTRAAFRISADPGQHDARVGFRIARDL